MSLQCRQTGYAVNNIIHCSFVGRIINLYRTLEKLVVLFNETPRTLVLELQVYLSANTLRLAKFWFRLTTCYYSPEGIYKILKLVRIFWVTSNICLNDSLIPPTVVCQASVVLAPSSQLQLVPKTQQLESTFNLEANNEINLMQQNNITWES